MFEKIKTVLMRKPGTVTEAARQAPKGHTVVRQIAPTTWQSSVSAASLEKYRSLPVIQSAYSALVRLCFSGFDHSLSPVDPSDDTQQKKIERAYQLIKKIEKSLGVVGRAKKVGTVGLVRAAAQDGWTFRSAIFEIVRDGDFVEILHLPASSFGQSAPRAFSNGIPDKILPGVVFLPDTGELEFYQYTGTETVQLNPENILYLLDQTTPEGTSRLSSLAPIIEQWKEIRKFAIVASKRVSVPNEIASIDAKDLAAMADSKIPFRVNDLINYCKDLTEEQSYTAQKVALPAVKLHYPDVSLPLNPWEADAYLKQEIIAHFFHRDILEITAQALSATNAPMKELLDMIVAGEREIWGRPFEIFWTELLQEQGFEVVDEFIWWDWAPKNVQIETESLVIDFRSHAISLNEYREKRGYRPLSPEEISALAAEHQTLFGKKDNVLNPSNTTVVGV